MATQSIDTFKASAETDGAVTLDFNGYKITVHPGARHILLNKIRTAVQMADVADPDNDQLNTALTK